MKRLTLSKLIQLLPRVVCWILRAFKLEGVRPARDFAYLISCLSRVLKTRGEAATILYIKNVRAQLMNYLSGNPLRAPGVRCTKDGIPLALGPLVGIIRGEPTPEYFTTLQVVTSILFSTRALYLGRLPDISPVISCYSGNRPDDLMRYAKSFWKELGYMPSQKVPKSLRFTAYHLTTKQGPNGHALWTSLEDLFILPGSLLESIYTLGGDVIRERIEVLMKIKNLLARIPPYYRGTGIRTRKLSYFPDRETKVRVIAVLDYWSQTVLKPLHSYLFRVLRKISQDCTFSQGSFKDKACGWDIYYSVDLTAATDRFPIAVIADLLKAKLPTSYVDAWEDVMVGYPFDFRGEPIRYAVGNPMGAYSSWASFAVAHHYVMYYCCRKLNISFSTAKYCLLGDDIVIGHKELAELYLSVVKSLGVEVSALKTHVSTTTFEFAKRWIHKGQEITPFPISALREGASRSYVLAAVLLETENKGWLSIDGISKTVQRFYSIVLLYPSRLCRVFEEQSYTAERMMRVIRGTLPAEEVMNDFIRKWGYPIRQLTKEESEGILSNVAVESFADSNPENEDLNKSKRDCVGLGPLAIGLVQVFTGLEEPLLDLGLQAIYAHPLLGAYALIEEMFMRLKREALRISSPKGEGDWPMILKTMALPWDDRIFIQRSNHLMAKASAIIGKKLRERFAILASPMGRAMLG